jgi:hypothetical protein
MEKKIVNLTPDDVTIVNEAGEKLVTFTSHGPLGGTPPQEHQYHGKIQLDDGVAIPLWGPVINGLQLNLNGLPACNLDVAYIVTPGDAYECLRRGRSVYDLRIPYGPVVVDGVTCWRGLATA